MNPLGIVPRRCVNLPPGSLQTLLSCLVSGRLQHGPDIDQFARRFEEFLGAEHVFGLAQGRSAFTFLFLLLTKKIGRRRQAYPRQKKPTSC